MHDGSHVLALRVEGVQFAKARLWVATTQLFVVVTET